MSLVQADTIIQTSDYCDLVDDYEFYMGDHYYYLDNADCVVVTQSGDLIYIEC